MRESRAWIDLDAIGLVVPHSKAMLGTYCLLRQQPGYRSH